MNKYIQQLTYRVLTGPAACEFCRRTRSDLIRHRSTTTAQVDISSQLELYMYHSLQYEMPSGRAEVMEDGIACTDCLDTLRILINTVSK